MQMLFRPILPIALIALLLAPVFARQQHDENCSEFLYGLYYGSWDNKGSELAFVISPDGKPIPPKENDPSAPTKPGFYVEEKRYEFDSSTFSKKELSFRTEEGNGVAYSFVGQLGCEPVEDIPAVPYMEGELKELKKGAVVRKKKLHFAHAVVL